MWERIKLKEKAKITFKRYYWKAVLVSLIAFVASGGIGEVATNVSDMRDIYNSAYSENYTEDYEDEFFNLEDEVKSMFEHIFGDAVVLLFVDAFTLVLILSLLIKLFIVYPLIIGKNNYFMGIRKENKSVKSLLFVYKNKKLKNPIITMFMMDLFIYLWSLLLLIPGIVKSYEYRMIPYILSENPNISRSRAFQISKNMMNGNKWNAFELDFKY